MHDQTPTSSDSTLVIHDIETNYSQSPFNQSDLDFASKALAVMCGDLEELNNVTFMDLFRIFEGSTLLELAEKNNQIEVINKLKAILATGQAEFGKTNNQAAAPTTTVTKPHFPAPTIPARPRTTYKIPMTYTAFINGAIHYFTTEKFEKSIIEEKEIIIQKRQQLPTAKITLCDLRDFDLTFSQLSQDINNFFNQVRTLKQDVINLKKLTSLDPKNKSLLEQDEHQLQILENKSQDITKHIAEQIWLDYQKTQANLKKITELAELKDNEQVYTENLLSQTTIAEINLFLANKANSPQQNFENLKSHICTEDFIRNYLQLHSKNNIGPHLAIAWAKAANRCLRVWEKQDSLNLLLSPVFQNNVVSDKNPIDLLANERNYEKLICQSTYQEEPILSGSKLQPAINVSSNENNINNPYCVIPASAPNIKIQTLEQKSSHSKVNSTASTESMNSETVVSGPKLLTSDSSNVIATSDKTPPAVEDSHSESSTESVTPFKTPASSHNSTPRGSVDISEPNSPEIKLVIHADEETHPLIDENEQKMLNWIEENNNAFTIDPIALKAAEAAKAKAVEDEKLAMEVLQASPVEGDRLPKKTLWQYLKSCFCCCFPKPSTELHDSLLTPNVSHKRGVSRRDLEDMFKQVTVKKSSSSQPQARDNVAGRYQLLVEKAPSTYPFTVTKNNAPKPLTPEVQLPLLSFTKK